jgi:hypothetical protein
MLLVVKKVSILNAECNTIWMGEGENLGFVDPKVYTERYELNDEQIERVKAFPLPQEVLSD